MCACTLLQTNDYSALLLFRVLDRQHRDGTRSHLKKRPLPFLSARMRRVYYVFRRGLQFVRPAIQVKGCISALAAEDPKLSLLPPLVLPGIVVVVRHLRRYVPGEGS